MPLQSFKVAQSACFIPSTLIFFTLLLNEGFSQTNYKNIKNSNQQWIQYYSKIKLSEKYTILSDGGFRWRNNLKENSLALIRSGLSYNFHEQNSVAFSLASFFTYKENKINRVELRSSQELSFLEQIKRVYLSNRVRLEERYFKNIVNNELSSDYNFNYRFRYRFYVSMPLNNNTLTDKTFFINVGDELFINFGKEIIYNLFDNNRIVAGLGYQINKKISLNLNYTSQFSQNKTPNSFEKTDIIWLSFTQNISFSKNNE